MHLKLIGNRSAQTFFLGAEFTRQYPLQFGSLCPDGTQ